MAATSPEVWLLLDDSAGAELDAHVLWLAQALRRQGMAAGIVALGRADEGRARLPAAPADVRVRPLGGTPAALLAALARERPLLIHTHGSRAGLWGRLCGWLLGIPVVSTVLGGRRRAGRRCLADWGDRLSLSLARGLLALGGPFPPLPPGARAIDQVVPLAPAPVTLPRTVAYVGSLDRHEGPELFCRLASMLPPIEFSVYGDGPLRGELNRRYPYLSFIADRATGIPWHDIGLLCVTASGVRGYQRSLEAMSHGVPVVAFASPALARLVRSGESGWLVNPGNLAAMARIVDRWERLDEDARRALSDGARRCIAERFSPLNALSTVLAVYARAVS